MKLTSRHFPRPKTIIEANNVRKTNATRIMLYFAHDSTMNRVLLSSPSSSSNESKRGNLFLSRKHFVDEQVTTAVSGKFADADGALVATGTKQALMGEWGSSCNSLKADVEELEDALEAPHEAGLQAGRREAVTVERVRRPSWACARFRRRGAERGRQLQREGEFWEFRTLDWDQRNWNNWNYSTGETIHVQCYYKCRHFSQCVRMYWSELLDIRPWNLIGQFFGFFIPPRIS